MSQTENKLHSLLLPCQGGGPQLEDLKTELESLNSYSLICFVLDAGCHLALPGEQMYLGPLGNPAKRPGRQPDQEQYTLFSCPYLRSYITLLLLTSAAQGITKNDPDSKRGSRASTAS